MLSVAELDRQRLGEADHAPFRRRIGRAQGKAELAGGRGDIDDRGVLALRRCGTASRVQLNWPVRSICRQRSQSSGFDLLDAAGRPGDAGIVDQHVEAAECCHRIREQARDRLAVGDVAAASP